ncbi:MAG: SRPBCC family protein [Myxococcota bacterium]
MALAAGVGIVGVYLHGLNQPPDHVATVEAVVPVSPEAAAALLVDLKRRPTWRPHVTRIGRGSPTPRRPRGLARARPARRSLRVRRRRVTPQRLVIEAAHPEQLGLAARWIWTLDPVEGGTRVRVTEEGTVDNDMFRGWWSLRFGPKAAIASDLAAFTAALTAPAEG